MRILAEVRQLDRHLSGWDPRAGKGISILVRDGLNARREVTRLRCLGLPGATERNRPEADEEPEGGDDEVPGPGAHFRIAGWSKLAAFGMIASESVPNHCSRMEQ